VAYGASIATGYSRPYWDGLAEGRIRLQRCIACGQCQNFPQARCRQCLSDRLDWIDANGTGTLHSYSTVHRAPSAEFAADAPYVVGLVRLPEGVQLMARILVDDESQLALDMAVRAKPLRWHGEGYVLGFVPDAATRVDARIAAASGSRHGR
jgi:uncharacterized protein